MKKMNLSIRYWLLALIFSILLPSFTHAQKQDPADELAQLFGPLINFEFAAPIETVIKNFGEGAIEDTLNTGYVTISVDQNYQKSITNYLPNNLNRLYNRLVLEKDEIRLHTRKQIDSLLSLTGYKVSLTIIMVDDRTGLTADDYSFLTTRIDQKTGKRHVWPSIGNSREDDGSGYHQAWIYVGEHWLDQFGMISPSKRNMPLQDIALIPLVIKAIFIHDPNTFYWLDETASGYMNHEGKFVEELWPDKRNATVEGIANYYSNIAESNAEYSTIEYTMEKKLDHFIENPGYRYLIQETSPLAGVSALKEAPHAKKDYVGVKGREYTFLNMPGYYLLFSQTTTFAFLNTFYNYAYSDNELSHHLINKAISKTWETRDKRHLMFLVNELAVQMEDFAGTKAAGKYNHADFEWQSSSMLPFFLLDVLTHFDMDEAEFKRVYSNHEYERQPRAFQTYWQYRTELQELTAPHLNTSNFKIYEAMAVGHEYLKNKKLYLKTLR